MGLFEKTCSEAQEKPVLVEGSYSDGQAAKKAAGDDDDDDDDDRYDDVDVVANHHDGYNDDADDTKKKADADDFGYGITAGTANFGGFGFGFGENTNNVYGQCYNKLIGSLDTLGVAYTVAASKRRVEVQIESTEEDLLDKIKLQADSELPLITSVGVTWADPTSGLTNEVKGSIHDVIEGNTSEYKKLVATLLIGKANTIAGKRHRDAKAGGNSSYSLFSGKGFDEVTQRLSDIYGDTNRNSTNRRKSISATLVWAPWYQYNDTEMAAHAKDNNYSADIVVQGPKKKQSVSIQRSEEMDVQGNVKNLIGQLDSAGADYKVERDSHGGIAVSAYGLSENVANGLNLKSGFDAGSPNLSGFAVRWLDKSTGLQKELEVKGGYLSSVNEVKRMIAALTLPTIMAGITQRKLDAAKKRKDEYSVFNFKDFDTTNDNVAEYYDDNSRRSYGNKKHIDFEMTFNYWEIPNGPNGLTAAFQY